MALAATFEPSSSRVRLELSGADGATMATFYRRLSTSSQRSIVRGGFEASVTGGLAPLVFDYEFPVGEDGTGSVVYSVETDTGAGDASQTVAVTVADEAWLKFPGFPFLNRQLQVIGRGSVGRAGRGSMLQILSNRYPVAVQEYMASRTFDVTVRTTTWAEYADLDTCVALGAIVYLHGDQARLGLPSVYGVVRSVTSAPAGPAHSQIRYTTISLEEVASPSYLYTGPPSTWNTVLTNYTTWQALLDAQDTWLDVLALEGTAADVVVS